MSTDALAALLARLERVRANDFTRPTVPTHAEQWDAEWLRKNGVVVLPADHPLRTGEPSEAMLLAAATAFSNLDVPNHLALEAAVRAALAVLREGAG